MTPREDPLLRFSTVLSGTAIVGILILQLQCILKAPVLNGGIGPSLTEPVHKQPASSNGSAPNGSWGIADIWRAREDCMHVLQSISADVEFLPPIKTEKCEVPAAVRLKGLGSNPKLVFDPPVETNCRMMAALHQWTKATLQPEARRTLQSPVSRIVGASAFACRNVYGLPTGNLSQHAFANAIDIGAFELSDGRILTVLHGWGATDRDLEEARKRRQAGTSAKGADLVGKQRRANMSLASRTSLTSSRAKAATKPGPADPAPEAVIPSPAALFLRRVHNGACSTFATALGPEANDAHRNHLHFDLNPVREIPHCD
jgi:hypothetical protein